MRTRSQSSNSSTANIVIPTLPLREMATDEQRPRNLCPKLTLQNGIHVNKWIAYFERRCERFHIDEEDRLDIFVEHLESEALTFFLNQCMDLPTWEAVKQSFHDNWAPGRKFSFEEFVRKTFDSCADVGEYFREKTEIAAELGLNESVIIEALSQGLPEYYRNIMYSHNISTKSQWIGIARKFVKNVSYEQRSAEPSTGRMPRPERERYWPSRPPPFRQRQFHPLADSRSAPRVPFMPRPMLQAPHRQIANHARSPQ